jgi:hypothetical protein
MTFLLTTSISTEQKTFKGQSHKNVGDMSVWGISLGLN